MSTLKARCGLPVNIASGPRDDLPLTVSLPASNQQTSGGEVHWLGLAYAQSVCTCNRRHGAASWYCVVVSTQRIPNLFERPGNPSRLAIHRST